VITCRGSSFGIANHKGLKGRESKRAKRRFSAPVQIDPANNQHPLLSRGWSGRDVALTIHHNLAPRLKK